MLSCVILLERRFMQNFDVIIIGAGAAGLMCSIEAGKRKRKVLVLDHANKAGKKILMSGGGRCNFTNYVIEPQHYLSANPAFCISALKRYTAFDFIELVRQHQIPFHEKSHGQLFCDNKSADILNMLLKCADLAKVMIKLQSSVTAIERSAQGFHISLLSGEKLTSESLVIATGGLSIPTMGASPFGYQIAEKFGLSILPTRAALVPFTLHEAEKARFSPLTGIALPVTVTCNQQEFILDMLFTHRGLSGPAILQISSYWKPGNTLQINLDPENTWLPLLLTYKKNHPKQLLKNFLDKYLPKRVSPAFFELAILETEMHYFSDKKLKNILEQLSNWQIKPNATEGYRTAEVTLGGVNTHNISSQTMEVHHIPGLYFIGEVLDVTGWLGGYNFQWAWSSGWACGQVV